MIAHPSKVLGTMDLPIFSPDRCAPYVLEDDDDDEGLADDDDDDDLVGGDDDDDDDDDDSVGAGLRHGDLGVVGSDAEFVSPSPVAARRRAAGTAGRTTSECGTAPTRNEPMQHSPLTEAGRADVVQPPAPTSASTTSAAVVLQGVSDVDAPIPPARRRRRETSEPTADLGQAPVPSARVASTAQKLQTEFNLDI